MASTMTWRQGHLEIVSWTFMTIGDLVLHLVMIVIFCCMLTLNQVL